LTKIYDQKTIFTFAPLFVTLVQYCVCTKLEVSTAFLLRENRRHGTDGRTDRQGATLNAVPHRGSHTAVTCDVYEWWMRRGWTQNAKR